MRRVRKPTILGAWLFWWPLFAFLLAGVTQQIYAPAGPIPGLFGGLVCAASFYLWRRQRYVRWLRGDDAIAAAQTTPARSS